MKIGHSSNNFVCNWRNFFSFLKFSTFFCTVPKKCAFYILTEHAICYLCMAWNCIATLSHCANVPTMGMLLTTSQRSFHRLIQYVSVEYLLRLSPFAESKCVWCFQMLNLILRLFICPSSTNFKWHTQTTQVKLLPYSSGWTLPLLFRYFPLRIEMLRNECLLFFSNCQ